MGTLFIVATPIGNLEDITLRALKTLETVDYIIAEDTRVTKKLLAHFDIHTPIKSYHSHSPGREEERIIGDLQTGKSIALVSDAGTPLISDPGVTLLNRLPNEITVVPIPGPSALTAALSAAGVPTHTFRFFGFLPAKKGRDKLFALLADTSETVVFFESPHRFMKTLVKLNDTDAHRMITIARELTKIYERFYRGTARELLDHFTEHPDEARGEFVFILSPK